MFLCRRVAFIISIEIMVYSNFWPLQHSSPTFLFTFWTEYHHNCHYWRLWDSSSVYFTVAFEVVLYNFIITHYTSCCTLHVLTVQFSFLIKNFNFKTGSENFQQVIICPQWHQFCNTFWTIQMIRYIPIYFIYYQNLAKILRL